MFTNEVSVVATPNQLSSDLAGEVIILDLSRGMYYGLDDVGALVWRSIQQPRTLASLREAVLAEYDVAPERCERDLHELLTDLAQAGLIEVRDGALA